MHENIYFAKLFAIKIYKGIVVLKTTLCTYVVMSVFTVPSLVKDRFPCCHSHSTIFPSSIAYTLPPADAAILEMLKSEGNDDAATVLAESVDLEKLESHTLTPPDVPGSFTITSISVIESLFPVYPSEKLAISAFAAISPSNVTVPRSSVKLAHINCSRKASLRL